MFVWRTQTNTSMFGKLENHKIDFYQFKNSNK